LQADIAGADPAPDASTMLRALQTHWGYNAFRPLQREAMQAVVAGRDSVVVLPTGGGKSLCYQLPATLLPGLAIVVSPLISLMKDQVDALTECGVPAAAVHSGLTSSERQRIAREIRAQRVKLLYVAPERLVGEGMLSYLGGQALSFLAIDEAHCISNWGHDFRPEYRMLGELRERFPGVGVHGFTATATEQVRQDIAAQLRLRNPEFLVGDFDRPNLRYRVLRRANASQQIPEALQRHAGESGIVYCISRKEVDALSSALKSAGVKAVPYHAGLSDEARRRNQDAFLQERADVVVATVAFGMGIDKSNVRFVLHTGAPKSLEHYQQETGRAGRDGLDAECCLLYSAADFLIWRKLNAQLAGDALQQANRNLRLMENYCASVVCRHRTLVEHFGQTYPRDDCQACDVCLDQQECLSDALVVSQKIMSCVLRVNEHFGADYVAQVLVGSREQRILDNRHDQLSTYGLLQERPKNAVRQWIEQLCGQDLLRREGDYGVLKVTPRGRQALRGLVTPRLLSPPAEAAPAAKPAARKSPAEGMDSGLFDTLRQLRRRLAEERGVPPFIVFGDVTLQDLARRRPTTPEAFRQTHGVGDHKAKEYGPQFIEEIVRYVAADLASAAVSKSGAKSAAEALFRENRSIDEVAQRVGRSRATVTEYLAEFLEQERRPSPEPWVDRERFAAIADAANRVGAERMKPVFDQLNGQCAYDEIRLALACLRNRANSQPAQNTSQRG
jgi:ATP-dependent DNA helicase RecQ